MAGPFSKDFVEQVRQSGDIAQLISDYVPLKGAGSRLKGLCPFHQEKTPSFSVDAERQLFYCFGCQTGGDVFKFVQLYEQIAFGEAVEMLARRFGVPLPARGQGAPKADDRPARVREIHRHAEQFYRKLMLDPEAGKPCRDYLERRGINERTTERLGLGYAPDSWESLSSHLRARRVSPGELIEGGLALARKSGDGQYDRFRGRLMFPIRDVTGRTVAFGGRALGDTEPKYMNSPETPAYVKGDHLYGLDLAREVIRREGFAIVVEGYMDLAALLQAGFENVVASLGTAFSPAQARLLARFTQRVVFSYDGDTAGGAATVRSVDLLVDRGFKVGVVPLPAGLDPDDFIRKEGSEAYGRLVRHAPEFLDYLVQRAAAGRDLSRIDEQMAVVGEVLPRIARLQSAIERTAWSAKLADTLGIDDRLVLQEMKKAFRAGSTTIRRRPEAGRPVTAAEVRLVQLLLASQEARGETRSRMEECGVDRVRAADIVRTILRLDDEGRELAYPTVLEALAEDDKALFTKIAFQEGPAEGPDATDCLAALKRARLEAESRAETRRIVKHQRNRDVETEELTEVGEVDAMLERAQELARQRDALN